jgi:hypothetical protein
MTVTRLFDQVKYNQRLNRQFTFLSACPIRTRNNSSYDVRYNQLQFNNRQKWETVTGMEYQIKVGETDTLVNLQASFMGAGIVVQIFNRNVHIGAVALGEYDDKSRQASVSTVTCFGHKDDIIAHLAAHDICKSTHKTTCVSGIHLVNTSAQIDALVQNARLAVARLLKSLEPAGE